MGLPMADMQATAPHDAEKELVLRNLAGVKRRIGVHSGKGGVGKTFVAVQLALALAHAGKSVGLLDADVDCPNVARALNLRDTALTGTAAGRIHPLEHRGMKVVSAHFLTDDPSLPMIVRGPIKHKVLAEFLSNVEWGALDALIVDLPPGTADVPMSSMLLGGVDGVVIVTTPQKESVMDARKSALMARDLGVPVLGVLENMAGEAFGAGAGKRLAGELGVPFLGSIPLDKDIRIMNESARMAFVEHAACRDAASSLLALVDGNVERKRSFWQRVMQR